MKDKVTITQDDFDTAIHTALQKHMEEENSKKNPGGAFIFAIGGAVFAREVMGVLFGEEEKTDE